MSLKRMTIMTPKRIAEHQIVDFLKLWFEQTTPLKVCTENHLSLSEQDFDAFLSEYSDKVPKKTGIIRYNKDTLNIPIGAKLPAYEETQGFDKGAPSRGILNIDYVIACQLRDTQEEEWLNEGVNSQKELIEKIQRRWHHKIDMDSIVTYYHIAGYNPNPSKREIKKILKHI
ncbi:hypothetical protein JW756_04135 [Candidatus Woesearchaeota archaeon]|nr:hypothetical protein [Candidatus Woesearchaeota archaeon]